MRALGGFFDFFLVLAYLDYAFLRLRVEETDGGSIVFVASSSLCLFLLCIMDFFFDEDRFRWLVELSRHLN